MKAEETLNALRKLKVDCFYTKDTQFNAGQRIHKEAHRFRFALVLGSIFAAASSIMNVGIWDKIPNLPLCIPVIVNLLGALGGFMIIYATTFTGYDDKIELSLKHSQTGGKINLLFKQIRNTEANYLDQQINEKELTDKLNDYTFDFKTICSAAPTTSPKDFEKAKENVKDGFADYTEEELKL